MKLSLTTPVIIMGAGGHAKVLIETLHLLGASILGITDPNESLHGQNMMGVPIIGNDRKIWDFVDNKTIQLVNALGSTNDTKARQTLFNTWQKRFYNFPAIIHPRAILPRHIHLFQGVQILAGAIINPNVKIEKNTIVNTGAIVEHDCIIGEHVHLAPGVRVAGNVTIGNSSHVGIGSTIIQGLTIGSNCLIAAGAVVIRSVPDNSIVMGVPGKIVKDRS
jgi:sugar O-acyltransferase (sialic acid O-acetyltransferase NeuD family)